MQTGAVRVDGLSSPPMSENSPEAAAPERDQDNEPKVLEEKDYSNIPEEVEQQPDSSAIALASAGPLTYQKSSEHVPIKRPSKKKPKDKPKRPLSAYNFFFKTERGKILAVLAEISGETMNDSADGSAKVLNDPNDPDYLDEETLGRLRKDGGKVSFEEMGKIIGQRWKNIDPDRLQKFSELAAEDTERYKKEMQTYNGRQEEKMRNEAMKPVPHSYPEAHMKNPPLYADHTMGYGPPPPGTYYGYPDAYQHPGSAAYPYNYPTDPMPQQPPMGGPPDPRSYQYGPPPPGSNYYGVPPPHAPPGYPMTYGAPADYSSYQQGMDYPYGGQYGGWGQQ